MFSITKVKDHQNSINYKEFTCDLSSDIAKLPTNVTEGTQGESGDVNNDRCAVGSTAFVIETASVYILGNDSLWHKIG